MLETISINLRITAKVLWNRLIVHELSTKENWVHSIITELFTETMKSAYILLFSTQQQTMFQWA